MSGMRIGLGVSRDVVRGVAIARDGRVLWHGSTPRSREESVADVVRRLVREAPAGVRGARLIAVVGPTEGQLRPLSGLPKVRALDELGALIRENAERFFVHEASRLRVSAPHSVSGEIWAAAVPESLVSDIAVACRSEGLRFDGVAPVTAAVARLLVKSRTDDEPSSVHGSWIDDGVLLRVELNGRDLVRVVRERAPGTEARGLMPSCPLPTGLPPALADAYAAALMRASDAFVIAQDTDDHRTDRRATLRTRVWSALAVICLAAAVLAPGMIATRQATRSRGQLAVLAARERVLRRTEAALARATLDLNLATSFELSRRSTTILLGELSYALPESTAVTTLRLDSLGGSMSVITPSAGTMLKAIAALPQLEHAQLTGSVTREVTSGVELEHAGVRFIFARSVRSPRPRTLARLDSAPHPRGAR
jgi:Tfp pilus assembly protein PilN